MKATDLMVGAWYIWYAEGKEYYYQVTKDTFNESDETIANFRPVPLTPEILEKNGFEVTRNMSSSRNKDVWSLSVSKDKMFHIIEHHNKRQFPYFWIALGSNSDIKYVHQLQHALRLCGIEKEIVI